MVQVQKAEKKAVYRYLLQEGVIVIHKDFTTQQHKGTNVPNIHARLLLRSLKDRGLVELVFSWQYFYYFIIEDKAEKSEEKETQRTDLREKEEVEEEDLEESAERKDNKHLLRLKNPPKLPQLDLFVQIISNQIHS